jgi:hypothetical protein
MKDTEYLSPTYIETFSEKVIRDTINKKLDNRKGSELENKDLIEASQDAKMITEMSDERLM